jgi:hypothetical protein
MPALRMPAMKVASIKGANLGDPEICDSLPVGDARPSIVGGQPARFRELPALRLSTHEHFRTI